MCVCARAYIYICIQSILCHFYLKVIVYCFSKQILIERILNLYYTYIYTHTYIRGVTMCIFIFNFSVRGFRFGMHYKPNDERFLKPASAPDAQHKDSTSLIDPCEACSEWNPSWKTSVWPWSLYCNSVSGCYRTSYRLGHLCGEQQF